MFDRNEYKKAFRRWMELNPTASDEEALGFCRALMPPQNMAGHYWLIDQCLQWFQWARTQPGHPAVANGSEDGSSRFGEETH